MNAGLSKRRTRYIKSNHAPDVTPVLNTIVVALNKARNIETTLVLDTNIVVAMQKLVRKNNKWATLKEYGLHNLVKFLSECPPKSICLSVGNALAEMPPGLAAESVKAYNLFVEKYLPGFRDTPNATYREYEGKVEDYGFFDLSLDARCSLSISFSSLLYLNLVFHKTKGTAVDKFNQFLLYMEKDIDFMSLTEIEIAKYCLEDEKNISPRLRAFTTKLRRNFLVQNPKCTVKDIFSSAYNGACDIHLLQSANLTDAQGLDGVAQDTWIATLDEKLVEFCGLFHHFTFDGDVGKAGAKVVHPEHVNNAYWQYVDSIVAQKIAERNEYHEYRKVDFYSFDTVAQKAADTINNYFLIK